MIVAIMRTTGSCGEMGAKKALFLGSTEVIADPSCKMTCSGSGQTARLQVLLDVGVFSSARGGGTSPLFIA